MVSMGGNMEEEKQEEKQAWRFMDEEKQAWKFTTEVISPFVPQSMQTY